MQTIPVSIVTSESDLVRNLTRNDLRHSSLTVEIQGVGVLSDIRVRSIPSMTAQDIVLSFVISVASNFFVNGISTWLTQAFPEQKAKIYIAEDPVRKITLKELEEAIENCLQKHRETLKSEKESTLYSHEDN